jgi:7,8-dihydropterin-6-yl-methyl-4-(beta-D-ribofuranosyl)aminobenzene 5'-phosphate synthase
LSADPAKATVGHVCDDSASSAELRAAAPRPAGGPAADPVTLAPVDEVTVTTLVDNTFDALLVSSGLVSSGEVIRPPTGVGMVSAAAFTDGRTSAGLRAEHGFSALVTVRRGTTRSTLLFDTGVSPDGMAVNIERLGIDVGDLQGVVLSARPDRSRPPAAGGQPTPSFSAASLVPVTRFAIFWKATSRA